MKEEWKDIEGYEGIYKISNLGRVKSMPRHGTNGGIMSACKDGKGYLGLCLNNKNGGKAKKIARLIAKAFIPNPENKPQVNHINGVKADNRIENLEWCTASENTKHAFDTGLINMGKFKQAQRGKKLSEECKRKISEAHKGKPTWNKGLTKETDKRLDYERPTAFKKKTIN